MSLETATRPASDGKKRKVKKEEEEDVALIDEQQVFKGKRKAVNPEIEVDEDAEALSHAEQRKRRKLEKQKQKASSSGYIKEDIAEAVASASAGTIHADRSARVKHDAGAEAEEDRKSSKKSATANQANAKRSGFGVWVGNLSFATDADKIKQFFASCGPITRLHMPKGNGKLHHNKGFAYVDFEDQEAAQAAIALSEKNLDGRRLLIKDSKDYAGRPQGATSAATAALLQSATGEEGGATSNGEATTAPKVDAAGAGAGKPSLSKSARRILDRQKQPPAPTLFIGNLGFETEVEMIQELFDKHAESNRAWQSKKGKKQPRRTSDGKGKKREKTEDSENEESGTDSSDDNDAGGDKGEEGSNSDADAAGGTSEVPGDKERDGAKSASAGQRGKPERSAAGIRKIRMGTFEDSGKCKGWAFVDFHEISQATLSLIDLRNHRLNGRELKVEYASAEAVRRGGGARSTGNVGARSGGQPRGGRRQDVGAAKTSSHGNTRNKAHRADESGPKVEEAEGGSEIPPPQQAFYRPPLAENPYKQSVASNLSPTTNGKMHKPNKEERAALREERKKNSGKRQKPGAALADAKREKVAIQPAQGKKITFD